MLANVENQMLIITSNSQKHQEQVAFLSVRLAHTGPRPRLPQHPVPGFQDLLGPGVDGVGPEMDA